MKKTLISITTILFFHLISIFSFAQEKTEYEFIESGKVRLEAYDFIDQEEPDYNSCIELLQKINENDTNYYSVQYDIAYYYYLDSADEKCIEVCNNGLLRPNEETSNFVNIKGLALKRMGNYKGAIELYQEYLKVFPKDFLLMSNLANSYYKNEEYQKAYDFHKKAIKINPYKLGSYTMMGNLLAKSGQLTAASLSYHMALLIDPTSSNSSDIIFYMEKVMTNQHKLNDTMAIVDKEIPEYFNEIDQILRCRLALNPKYKVKSAFDYSIIRSSQVMCEKLQDPGNDTTYWGRFITRNFYDIWQKDLFEGYSYYFFQSLTNTTLKKKIEKRAGAITKFQEWAVENITNNLLIDRRVEEKDFIPTQLSFYKSKHLYGYGPINDDASKRIGYWTYFHENGSILSAGKYNSEGERTGLWNWYSSEGLNEESITYKEGKYVGLYTKYNDLGFKIQEYNYNEDSKIEGEVLLFNDNGVKSGKPIFKDGKRNGMETSYYSNGQIEFTLDYVEGKASGDFIKYYNTGELYTKVKYLDDKMIGDYIQYYKNGQVKSSGKMEDNSKTGLWEYHYENGQLQKEAEFKKGTEIGEVKSYYENGSLKSQKNLDESGKLNGVVKNYDEDGILYETYDYKKGIIVSIRSFDKKGTMTHSFEKEKAILDFESYTPQGYINSKGSFSKKGREGDWIYYTPIGIKEATLHYNDGSLDGEYLNLFPDGSTSTQQFYKEGALDSIYRKYYQNGSPYVVGYTIDGYFEGLHFTTTPQGDTTEVVYYNQGNLHGRNHYYVRGKDGNKQIKRTFTYHNGTMLGVEEYDENGKVFYEKKLVDGNGKVELHFPNQELFSTREYINGEIQGNVVYYWGDNVRIKAIYKNGERSGEWIWYFGKDQIETKGFYKEGKREGQWIDYYRNGNVYWSRGYEKGKLNGLDTIYHENGNISYIVNRKDSKRQGMTKYFGNTGNLYMTRYYEQGEIIGYSYAGSDGKIKPMIPLKNGNGKAVCYYANGKKSFDVEFKNGVMHGDYKSYHKNGRLWKAIPIYWGDNEGLRKEYYADGKIKSEQNFKNGYNEGESKWYYPNGKLEQVSQFWFDDKHGTTQLYDESGKLKKTQVWFEGDLMEEY